MVVLGGVICFQRRDLRDNRIGPLARHVGLPTAGFLVFLISGLVHEVVISLPVRAGFGLPTLYFALQAAGVAFERSHIGRGMGLGRGTTGWVFVFVFAVGPLYWLFHPAFLERVLIPFLNFVNHS